MLLKVWNMLNKPWHITTHFNMTRAKRNIVCYIAIIIRFFLIITGFNDTVSHLLHIYSPHHSGCVKRDKCIIVPLRLQSLHQLNTNIVIETTYGASVAPIARP